MYTLTLVNAYFFLHVIDKTAIANVYFRKRLRHSIGTSPQKRAYVQLMQVFSVFDCRIHVERKTFDAF